MMMFGRLCLGLVCCAHMAVLMSSCVYVRDDTSIWFQVVAGFAFAQVGLTAVFAGLGGWPLIVRLPTWALIGTLPLVMLWIIAVHAHFVEDTPWMLAPFALSWVLIFFFLTAIRFLPSVHCHLAYVRGASGDRPATNKQYSLLELFMVVAAIAVLLLLVRRLIPPSWENLWDDLSYPELPEPTLLEALSLAAVAAAIHVIVVVLLLGSRRWLAWTGLGMYAVAAAALWIWAPIEVLLLIGTWTTTLVLTLLAARARGIRLIGGRRATECGSDDPLPATRRERFVLLFENPAVLAVLAVGGLYVWLDHTSVLTTYRFVLAGHARQDDHGSVVELDFAGASAEEFSLADVGSLHNVTELNLGGTETTDTDLRHIQGLTNLEELTLRSTKITDDGLRYLKNLTRLRWVDLSDTAISDEGLRHLHELQEFEILWLMETKVTLAGACELARRLDSLREVDLDRFGWDDTCVGIRGDCSQEELRLVGSLDRKHLAFCEGQLTRGVCEVMSSLAGVEAVTLNRVRGADIAVGQMKDMPDLRELRLWGEGTTDDLLNRVADLRQLKRLRVQETEITTDGFQQLSSLVGLTSLSISGSNVTDDALRHVGRLTSLEELVLWDTTIQDLSPLAKLTSLKSLHLWETPFKDLPPLARLTNLERLEVWQTPATDLSPLANLGKLKELYIRDTPATPQEIEKLLEALPDCSIDDN